MLKRMRIEVDGEDSAAACEAALTKYEHALQVVEARRYGLHRSSPSEEVGDWDREPVDRDFFSWDLGREVTDEVIEYDPSVPGYRGRRVVQFRRIDTRSAGIGLAEEALAAEMKRLNDMAETERGEALSNLGALLTGRKDAAAVDTDGNVWAKEKAAQAKAGVTIGD